jgi:amino acid permease
MKSLLLLLLSIVTVTSFQQRSPLTFRNRRSLIQPTKQPSLTVSTSQLSTSLHASTPALTTTFPQEPLGTGTASVTAEIFNLVKAIVGAGVLTLPAGIAAFGNAPSAAMPAVFFIALIGTLSGYGFALIGRVCALVGATSYRDAWDKSVSPSTSGFVAVSVTAKTIFATLAYSMILADTFQSLVSVIVPGITKATTLTGVTAFLLLPLCLLKNLSSLAPFSLMGTLGMMYTAAAMGIRYFGKAYVANGQFAKDLPVQLRPAFGSLGATAAFSPKATILLGMLSTAYMAHFNVRTVLYSVCLFRNKTFECV